MVPCALCATDETGFVCTDACKEAGESPINVLLFCPKCGLQHIDRPNHYTDKFDPPDSSLSPAEAAELEARMRAYEAEWTNPPHRSHLCHQCGHVWRPADVPTNGVPSNWIKTKGAKDSPIVPDQMAALYGERYQTEG